MWIRTAILTIALASNAVVACGPAAARPTVVTSRDPWGDTRILSTSGPSLHDLTSIDIRRVALRSGTRQLRATFHLRRIVSDREWDQMVFVDLAPVSPTASWEAYFGATTQGAAFALWASDGDYTDSRTCVPEVTVHRGTATVVIDVPRRRVPEGEARIRVSSSTGYYETDAPPYSRDSLRIRDGHALRASTDGPTRIPHADRQTGSGLPQDRRHLSD